MRQIATANAKFYQFYMKIDFFSFSDANILASNNNNNKALSNTLEVRVMETSFAHVSISALFIQLTKQQHTITITTTMAMTMDKFM